MGRYPVKGVTRLQRARHTLRLKGGFLMAIFAARSKPCHAFSAHPAEKGAGNAEGTEKAPGTDSLPGALCISAKMGYTRQSLQNGEADGAYGNFSRNAKPTRRLVFERGWSDCSMRKAPRADSLPPVLSLFRTKWMYLLVHPVWCC